MSLIYIIRHGETDANVKDKINDKNNKTPLNSNGKKQATMTGKYLNTRNLQNAVIYVSPSIRAVQTAELIAKELKINKISIIKDDRIDEINHGLLSGTGSGDKIYDELMEYKRKNTPSDIIDKALYDKGYSNSDNYIVKKYKAESIKHIFDRIKSFFKALSTNKKNIIVVTHNGIIQLTTPLLFNIIPAISGNISNGKNCTIMCILNEKKKYTLLTLPNTLHLKK